MAPADCYCSFHWWSQCTKWGFHQPLTGHRRPRLRLPPQLEEHYISLNCSLSVSFYSSTSSCTTSTTVWLCVSGCRKRGRTSSFSEEAHGGDRRHRAQSLLSRYHKCSFGLSVDLTRSRIAHSTAHLTTTDSYSSLYLLDAFHWRPAKCQSLLERTSLKSLDASFVYHYHRHNQQHHPEFQHTLNAHRACVVWTSLSKTSTT